MKADIVMHVDGEDFVYGTYDFNTKDERNRVNDIASQIKQERRIDVWVRRIEE